MEKDQADVFTEIFENNLWKGKSRSGTGSNLTVTKPIRTNLKAFIQDHSVTSVVDAPCGDANWIAHLTPMLDVYIGLDIVPALIAGNLETYQNTNMAFAIADITKARFPKADLVFCRDCLVHLPLELGQRAIQNFAASDFRFVAMTTFPGWAENIQSRIGSWRPLDLQKAPFLLPPPLQILGDRHDVSDDPYYAKSIGVWEMAALRDWASKPPSETPE